MVEGRELVQIVQEQVALDRPLLLVVIRNGQLVLSERAQRFQETIEYDQGSAIRIHPAARHASSVVMDPQRARGQPAVRGVRTEILAEDYRAGASREDLADLYDLSAIQVDDAIRFELITSRERAA